MLSYVDKCIYYLYEYLYFLYSRNHFKWLMSLAGEDNESTIHQHFYTNGN